MENQLPNQEQVSLTQKKEWIEPMMEVMNIMTGITPNAAEGGGYAAYGS